MIANHLKYLTAGLGALLCVTTSAQTFAADQYGLPTAKAESVGMSTERLKRIAPAIKEFVDARQIPGALTVVARHGKIVHFNVQGWADAEKKKPLKADTIFRLASQTKPVTGVAVMIAFEDGKFLMNDPVSKYLPEFKDMTVYTEDGLVDAESPITVRQLMSHTSGLTLHFFDNPVSKMYRENGVVSVVPLSLADYVKKVAEQPLLAQPGTAWNYSTGMDVLGRLIEVWYGTSYEEFLQARLFRPLGMKDTTFHVPMSKKERIAQAYVPDEKNGMAPLPDDHDWSVDKLLTHKRAEKGGGGLMSTAADYMRFAQMLVNGGELDGVRILSPTSIKLMSANHLPESMGDSPLSSLGNYAFSMPGIGFGLTVSVITDPVAAGMAGPAGQYGWGGAFSTDFWIDPESELVGMILTQLLPSGTYPTRARMQQMTYQAVLSD